MPIVLKVLSVRNVVVLIELRTTDCWLGVAKPIPSLILLRRQLQMMYFFFFLFINLLHGAQSQSVADYLQQVAYSFRGLRGQKPPLQADRNIIIVRRDQK